MPGYFITFEGGDGAGKSTQIMRLKAFLESEKRDVLCTREPGGTAHAEKIRELLLKYDFHRQIETHKKLLFDLFLFSGARINHIDEVIIPALNQGKIVLCDRYIDSTRVYQGYEGGLSLDFIKKVEKIILKDAVPDLTFILDLSAKESHARVVSRHNKGQRIERFETVKISILEKRRQAFLNIAQEEPERCFVINAEQDTNKVALDIQHIITEKLKFL